MTTPQELATVTDLSVALQAPAQDGFYSPETQESIKQAIVLSTGLVYPLDDAGEKAMKADATAINKFATELDKTAAAIYKARTELASNDRDITKEQVRLLKGNREKMIAQFEASKAKRIIEVRETLQAALNEAWEAKGVETKFRLGVLPPVKESMLTSSGNLNAESKRIIEQLSSTDMAWQSEINGRVMRVELECRRAGIDTPFTPEYIGQSFTSPDPIEFENRLKTLIKTEIDRMEAVKAKLIAEQEAIKQKEIQDALAKQQAEADRLAREKAQAEAAAMPEPAPAIPKPATETPEPESSEMFTKSVSLTSPEALRAKARLLRESAAHADKIEYANQDYEQAEKYERMAKELEAEAAKPVGLPAEEAIPGKKVVILTATFEILVPEKISLDAVKQHFKSQLNEKMSIALVEVHAR